MSNLFPKEVKIINQLNEQDCIEQCAVYDAAYKEAVSKQNRKFISLIIPFFLVLIISIAAAITLSGEFTKIFFCL